MALLTSRYLAKAVSKQQMNTWVRTTNHTSTSHIITDVYAHIPLAEHLVHYTETEHDFFVHCFLTHQHQQAYIQYCGHRL
jgi:hypothetical protein